MKKNYMLPEAELCIIEAEDILTGSFGIDSTNMFGIGEGDYVSFNDFT